LGEAELLDVDDATLTFLVAYPSHQLSVIAVQLFTDHCLAEDDLHNIDHLVSGSRGAPLQKP
jgi:hypothetical protein